MKKYLLSPGPTPVPESVSTLLARPIPHHRTPEFQALFQEVREGLKYVFQTQAEVLTLACSGTGAMDAVVANLFKRGDEVITINAGKFGERWTKISTTYGLKPFEITLEAGQTLRLAQLESAMAAHPNARGVLFQASETSTGVRLPTREICALANKAGMLSVCDAITACGVFELPMDAWNIDVMITGAQKALMIPPGLAFVALSDRAWAAAAQSDLPKFYFDLTRERKAQIKNQSAWTPATGLIVGLAESLRMIRAETLEKAFARHDLLARATRAAVEALGLEILAKEAPSSAVTAVRVPEAIQKNEARGGGKAIPKLMRDKYGVSIAGGQGELEGQIFRLSHFGYVGIFDVTIGISCLELVLNDLGYPTEFGRGVGAALRTFAEGNQANG